MLQTHASSSWLTQVLQCTTIPVLSCTQPWGTAMALGVKQYETRSWRTSHRGLLAIHTAKSFPEWAEDLCDEEPFERVLQEGGYVRDALYQRNRWQLPLGQVIAIGMLSDIQRITATFQVDDQERAFGNYEPGRFAWRFAAMYQLATPIPARGSLGLWNWQIPEALRKELQTVCNLKAGAS